MAESEEEVVQLCFNLISDEKCSFSTLRKKVSQHYNDMTLSSDDISSIKQTFIDTALKKWRDECESVISLRVEEIKNNKDELVKFKNDFTSQNAFDNAPNLVKTEFYKIIESDRELFSEEVLISAYKNVVFFVKLKIKEIQDDCHTESDFLEIFIEVLKNSNRQYENLVEGLKLKDFVNKKIGLQEVLQNILTNNFTIGSYEKLQKLCLGLQKSSDNSFCETIRNEIRSYVIMERKEIEEEGRKILLLMRKIIFLEDIEVSSNDVKDIRVVCDIFHFCGKAKVYKFPVENLIIIANLIQVHEKIAIDQSGKHAESTKGLSHSFSKRNARGKDGMDGNAGESGGNIAIACEKIENGDLLTLISNGGNGSHGGIGQDGVDGFDGQDVEKCNMTVFDETFDIVTYRNKVGWLADHVKTVRKTGERSGPVVPLSENGYIPPNASKCGLRTHIDGKPVSIDYYAEEWYKDDGLSRRYTIEWDYGGLLVKGKNGKSGTEGGLGGLGGEGGFAGKIDLEITDDGGKPIKVEALNGSTGIDGLGGCNGINGRDGRDAWTFHREEWSEPKYFGLDFNDRNKYEKVEVDQSHEFAVWSPWDNCYQAFGLKSTITQKTSVKERNKSAAIRSRASHAKTSRKKSTFHSSVRNKYSEYLNESFQRDDFLNEDIDLTLDMTKTTAKTKTKTKIQQTFSEEKFRKNLKKEEEIFTFDEVKEKLLKVEMKFGDFSEILRKSDLKLEEWMKLKNEYSALIDALPQSSDSMDVSNSSLPFFIETLAIENLPDYNLDYKDILKLINEKIIICEGFNEFSTKPLHESTSVTLPTTQESRIPYLVDTKHFNDNIRCENLELLKLVDFATLNHYFNSDLDLNRKQIRDLFFKLKQKFLDSFKSFNKAKESVKGMLGLNDKIDTTMVLYGIASILVKNKKEIKDLEKVLDQIPKNPEELQKFMQNDEISKFVSRNLIEEGIRSPIYRKLLSFSFEINFRIFVRKIDGTLCIIEEETKDGLKTMDLLMEKGKFTELVFDAGRYKRNVLKIQETKLLKEKIKMTDVDQKLSELNEKLLSYETSKTKLKDVKLSDRPKGNVEGKSNEKELEIQALINDVEKAHKLREKIQFVKALNTKVENRLNLIEAILSFFPEFSEELTSALTEFPDYILLSIYLHLFYERTKISIQEFSSIIFTVLENRNLFEYFAAKFVTCEQSKWIVEIILLQIENYLNQKVNFETFRSYLNSVSYHPILFLFLTKLEQLGVDSMTLDDFEKVLKNMRHFSHSTFQHLLNIQDLNSWQHVITSEYWLEKFEFLSDTESPIVNELQSKFDAESLERLLTIMSEKAENFEGLSIVEFLKNFNSGEWIFSNEQFDILEENEPKDWVEKINEVYTSEGQRSVDQVVNLIKENKDTSESIRSNINKVEDFANDVLMKELSNGSKYKLRNTQILSILAFCQSKKGALLQVGTGEGKTFVGATFALLKALNGEKIHVVTSSSVLAERDASDPEIQRIFRNFGIKIGHNCHDDSDDRRRTYMECGVVYGTLGNFQRDHLLTVFYDKNILPSEYFQNVLVDEVDSILLDKGNNILYLSKELPDVDTLESAFIFIWQWVNQETEDEQALDYILKPENIRQAFLENFYGLVFESDIRAMIGDDPKDVMRMLVEEEIINEEGVILVKEFSLNSLNISEDLKSKITFYIKTKIETPKVIQIPKYYHKFVMRYLDRWIKSALNAVVMQEGVQYVVDKVSGGSTVQSDPNIIILDVDTGTDQKNSEWDEALCQFLQLKHGCRLSELSLKSVFISNVSYFKLYKMKYGMTGTLGSKDEREKFNKFYDLEYATIPSYLPKKFTEYDAILTKTNSEWLAQIVRETEDMIGSGRSVLIICNTIKDIDAVENSFFNADRELFSDKSVITYKRDYEEFNLGFLLPKKVIIASNLAGRGTDIRLNDELAQNGGLHVILTYLAPNVRIENQAYGRAARAGAKGSARMIILKSTTQIVKDLKHERDQQELIRLEEVSNFYTKFVTVEEKFFKDFLDAYKKYSTDLQTTENSKEIREILLENFKVLWSLWLDENSELLNNYEKFQVDIDESFKNFIENSTKVQLMDVVLHPTLRVEVFKHFVKSKYFEEASKILSEGDCEGLGYEYNKILMTLNDGSDMLSDEKVNQIRSAVEMFKEVNRSRNNREYLIKLTKEKYRCTLKPMKGYENQLKELNEVDQVLINSLKSMLGTGVTPESFNCSPFSNFLYKEGFYKFLMAKGYIEEPTVDENIQKSDVNKIAQKYQVDGEKLFDILSQKSSQPVNFDELAEELKNSLVFPSREDFWETLINENILINQMEFALIDLECLNDFSPHIKDECIKKFEKYEFEVKTVTNREIFFTNVSGDEKKLKNSNNEQRMIAIALENEVKSDELFQQLAQNNLVAFNKKAIFNVNRFEEIKSSFKFDKFDSIVESDFGFIESIEVRTQVLERLIDQEILGDGLKLNYENLSHLKLEENFVYEARVEEVLRSCFKYRIALENLIEKMRENSLNININLMTCPQLMMIHDLVENFIILPSKINEEKIVELEEEEIFKEYSDRNFWMNFLQNGFNSDFKLPKNLNYEALLRDLLENKILLELKENDEESLKEWQEHTQQSIECIKDYLSLKPIVVYNLDNELSDRFKHIEKTVKIMLRSRMEVVANKDAIVRILKDAAPSFDGSSVPVLIPLEKLSIPLNADAIECMKLKGLDCVIGFEDQKFSCKLESNMITAMISTAGQFSLALKFFMMKKHTDSTFMFLEASQDVFYIMNSLKRGTFSWEDHARQKAMNIVWRNDYPTAFNALFNIFKRKQKQDKSYKLKPKDDAHQSKIDSTKPLLRRKKEGLVVSSVNANATAELTKKLEYIVTNAVESLTMDVMNVYMRAFYEKFINHEFYEKTIDKLLESQSESNVEELTLTCCTKVNDEKDYFKTFMRGLAEKVAEALGPALMSIDENNQMKQISFNEALSKTSVSILKQSIAVFLNDFNSKVIEEGKNTKSLNLSLSDSSQTSNLEIKNYLLASISDLMWEKLQNNIDYGIKASALKLATSKAHMLISRTFSGRIKENLGKENFSKIAIAKNLESIKNKLEVSTVGEDFNDILVKKATNIRKTAKNLETVVSFGKLKCPMEVIELEAAARVRKIKLIIQFGDIAYEFGEEGCEIVRIDIKDGNFTNDSNGRPIVTFESFYSSLKNKINMEEFQEKKFKNEIMKNLTQNEDIKAIHKNQQNQFYKLIGFYGIKECYNLFTLRGSQRFANSKDYIWIEIYGRLEPYLFKPNQDLRSFDRNGDAKTIDTDQAFNKYRADALEKTLEKVNEIVLKKFSGQKLTLGDFAVRKVVLIKESRDKNLAMPIEMALIDSKVNLIVILGFSLVRGESNEPEIPYVEAEMRYYESYHEQKVIFFKTLIPSMSKKEDNDFIPVRNCPEIIDRSDFVADMTMVDFTKIFDRKYSHLKLVTSSFDDENLPDVTNADYITKYPIEYGRLKDNEYFDREVRENSLRKQFVQRKKQTTAKGELKKNPGNRRK